MTRTITALALVLVLGGCQDRRADTHHVVGPIVVWSYGFTGAFRPCDGGGRQLCSNIFTTREACIVQGEQELRERVWADPKTTWYRCWPLEIQP